jgi:hypothetical protein
MASKKKATTNTKKYNSAISRESIARGNTSNAKAKVEFERAKRKYYGTLRQNAAYTGTDEGMLKGIGAELPKMKATKRLAKAQQAYGESVRSKARARSAETKTEGPKNKRKPLA